MEVDATPAPISNWNHSVSSQPAVVVRAKTAEDVCRAVKDASRFPSPVLAVGSAHSVTGVLQNDKGTIIDVSAMDAILGFGEVDGKEVVRVQCGVKLAALHKWLDARGKEISFSPEIGDATVGSIVGSTSKDSSVDAPGYFAALVAAVSYVDEKGELRTASLNDHPNILAQITCAYGLMGVIVEASLMVRKHTLVRTVMAMHPLAMASPGLEAARVVRQARLSCDNLFAIMHPLRGHIYTEQRWLVPGGKTKVPLHSPAFIKLFNAFKAACFKAGDALPRYLTPFLFANRVLGMWTAHRRYGFTNSYKPVTEHEARLDFSYFEFDLSRLDEVVAGCWELAAEHERRTGFCPNGFAIYFVQRPGGNRRLAGNYTGASGTSFMLDPIHGDPSSAEWQAFNEAYTRWAVAMGGNVSLSQTKALRSAGDGLGSALPSSMARDRFVTPFFRGFLVPDAEFFEQGSSGSMSYARPAGEDHPRKAALLAEYERLLGECERLGGGARGAAPAAKTTTTTPSSSAKPAGSSYSKNLVSALGLGAFSSSSSSLGSDATEVVDAAAAART